MPKKSWMKMSAAELAKATREFDRPSNHRAMPVPPKERAKLERANRPGPGRPRLGTGAARVLFTMDPALLKAMDAYAEVRGMKRSSLISASVEAYIGAIKRPTGTRNGDSGRRASHGSSSVRAKPTPIAAMAG